MGWAAYESDKSINENPFDRSTDRVDHFAWREGWLRAHGEDRPA
jgi:hypothetical protein